MPSTSLPENPSLENLKKNAKRLLKAVRSGDEEAIARVRELHPHGEEAIAGFSLSGAQLVTARGYGFASWSKLKNHLEAIGQYTWHPPTEPGGSPADRFIRLACVDYGAWNLTHAEMARRLAAAHPELAEANIYAAATIGDIAAVRTMVARDPALANTRGGPLRWEPLLYACYSRLNSDDPNHSTLEAARLLLEAGADPNAGFLWGGNIPPFTALTGAFGEGEAGENNPPHQHWRALALLLLDAGADPNDGQTLYNRHFNRNDDHLKLLFSYGLGEDKGGPWFRRLGSQLESPSKLLIEELWSAARRNLLERVQLLVAHAADVNTPGRRDGRTPYEAAIRAGNDELAEYLLEHGAKRVESSDEDAFAAACINGRRAEAIALLEKDPQRVGKLGFHARIELLHRAVEANRPDGIRLMAELGFELREMTHHDGVGINLAATPLHNAAWTGNLELVKLLVDLGADPQVRDPNHHSTPLGWAAYNKQEQVVDYLLPFATIFDAIRCDGIERVATLLQKDPSMVNAIDGDGNPLVFSLHGGMKRLKEMIALLLAHGVDINARNRSGKTLLDRVTASGDSDFATVLRGHGFEL